MICISILCFGHIANKFNVILSILKEVIIFPGKGDLFRIGKTNMNTKIRFFSFVEFPYEGKKLAAYAEKRVCTFYLHMETIAKSWSQSIHIFWQYEKLVTIFRKNNNLLEY